jgi:benzoyl-CoA reductase/2-hydroxyglutaryl-CoA dehydratase subunit BcrC/BadD/HgdB
MAEYEHVLKPVAPEKAFYFYNSVGNYTGKSAASLKEFAQRVKEVDQKSLGFHLQRGDFENWFAGVLKDEELAKQVKDLRTYNPTSEALRDRLNSIVSRRLDQLTHTPTMQKIPGIRTENRWRRY